MTKLSFLGELLSIKQSFIMCATGFQPKGLLLKVPFFLPYKDIVKHSFRVIYSTLGPLGNRNDAL